MQTGFEVLIIISFVIVLFLCCGWSLHGGPKASQITRTKPDPNDDGLFLVRSPSSSRVKAIGKGNDSAEYDLSSIQESRKKSSKENS